MGLIYDKCVNHLYKKKREKKKDDTYIKAVCRKRLHLQHHLSLCSDVDSFGATQASLFGLACFCFHVDVTMVTVHTALANHIHVHVMKLEKLTC